MEQLRFPKQQLDVMRARRKYFPDADGRRTEGQHRRWINVKGSNIIAMVDDHVYTDHSGEESLRVLYLMMDGTHFTRNSGGHGILHDGTIIKKKEAWYLDERSAADLDDILNRTQCTPQQNGAQCLLQQPSVSPVYEDD